MVKKCKRNKQKKTYTEICFIYSINIHVLVVRCELYNQDIPAQYSLYIHQAYFIQRINQNILFIFFSETTTKTI